VAKILRDLKYKNRINIKSLGMDSILPYMLLLDDDADDSDSLLMMVLLNSMTGGMNSAQGFDNNFNMLLPLLLMSDDSASSDGIDTNLFVLMMAMQSQVATQLFFTFKHFNLRPLDLPSEPI